jgi:Na+-transporting NADH:ubiquinone oxidoreductase subunit NqrA
MKHFILLVIGNEAQGTCTADDYASVERSIKAFSDIKKNGRNSTFLTAIKKDNNAGINFDDKSPIDVFLSVEDENCQDVCEHPFLTKIEAANCHKAIVI